MRAVEPLSLNAAAAPAPAVGRTVLDPRRKSWSVRHFRSSCEVVKERAENDVKKVIEKFVEASNQLPVVVEVEAGLPDAPMAMADKRKFSRLEQRCQAQLKRATDGRGSGAGGSSISTPVVSRRTVIGRELLVYLAGKEQADGRLRPSRVLASRGYRQHLPDKGKNPRPGRHAHYLAVIARLFHAIDGATCQAE